MPVSTFVITGKRNWRYYLPSVILSTSVYVETVYC